MRNSSILSSTPFRLALAFGMLCVLALLLFSGTAYELVRRDLERRLDGNLRETYLLILASYGEHDLPDLAEEVDTYARLGNVTDRVVELTDETGRHLAGNVTVPAFAQGWSTVPGTTFARPDTADYRVFAGEIDGNHLLIGENYAETEELKTIALGSFAWGSIGVIGVALAGGALLGYRARRRLAAIAGTMDAVAHGELAARIPRIGRGDDIDMLSGQINAALDRLAALVEGMRQVSTDIAHELKTPMNRLKLMIETAIGNALTGRSEHRPLMDARAETDRINATFDALLRIAQIEAGARRSRFTMTELDAIMATIAEIYGDVAELGDRVLKTRVSGTVPTIAGDRELLLQMLANLVENAIRHCPYGTRIDLSLEALNDGVALEVADDGPGIPEIERDKVFRRLYRLDKSRSTPGTGLGLSLVKAIAGLHGATLTLADNEPGLRVRIVFPRGAS